jgi:GNAT superfamily N-acetyltransferase
VIRPAAPDDAPAIGRLLSELGYPATDAEVAARVAGLAPEPRSRVLVADEDGVVGLAVLALAPVLHERGDWCRVTVLVVAPEVRGRGVGRALLAGAEAVARAAGCSRIEATSAMHREGAHAVYRRAGYETVSAHFLKRLRS